MQTIALIGGTGFVGTHLVSQLARKQVQIKVLTRRRERKRDLLVFPTLKLVETDVHDRSALTTALAGCDTVINLAGVLNERTRGDFARVHAELPQNIAQACDANGITRILHMSALHAGEDAPSEYLRSKGHGEQAVMAWQDRGIGVTCFAPSVIFGAGDSFFNRFATLLSLSPAGLLPLARAHARFAPVFVGDVVQAFVTALEQDDTIGQHYQLCGPRQCTLREIVDYTADTIGKRARVISLSDKLSRIQGAVLERLPGQPFSTDNYLSLQVDSVCTRDGLAALGIVPTTFESTVPKYVGRVNRAGRYQRFRSSAGR